MGKRGNGQGSARKRGRTWTAIWTLGTVVEEGRLRQIRQTKGGFRTKTDALAYAANPPQIAAQTSTPSLMDYWTIWSTTSLTKMSKSKQTAYKIAKRKVERIMLLPVDKLSINLLQETVDAKAPTYYPAKDIKTLLTHLYKRAVAEGWVSTMYGDNVIEKHGINRDRTGDREKTRYLCGKQGIFTRDRALIRPGFIRQLETRASTRSASFFHALGSPGRPHNGGGAAGAYRTRNGAKPLKQGHLRAKRGPLGPSRKSQQQTKRTGFAAHGHSIAETAPEGKRASCANGALIRA